MIVPKDKAAPLGCSANPIGHPRRGLEIDQGLHDHRVCRSLTVVEPVLSGSSVPSESTFNPIACPRRQNLHSVQTLVAGGTS
jgi:hypothetical protein